MIIRSPSQKYEYDEYYHLRWLVLRAPWRQVKGSEKDNLEEYATHRMALHESEVIACGRLHNADETTAQIRYMAVSKSFLRKGIGSKILASLEEVAIENNNKIILIHAREASVGFYKKKGYELLEKSHLLFNEVQHYKMQKKI